MSDGGALPEAAPPLGRSGAALERLETAVFRPALGDDAMLLSEFDGFVAALQTAPTALEPEIWLRAVWGSDAAAYAAERPQELELLTAHHRAVGAALDPPGAYGPLLDQDLDGSVLWEIWACGFAKAVALQPSAWAAHAASPHEAVRGAYEFFELLARIAETPGGALTEAERLLQEVAHQEIAAQLSLLRRARDGQAAERGGASAPSDETHAEMAGESARMLPQNAPEAERAPPPGASSQAASSKAEPAKEDPSADDPSATRRRPGRNDPCPCGSGRKYKKCCLRQKVA